MEQDLLLSRAMCAIAAHEYLGEELVFRGGTALHKLHLATGYRYSEDLDYVRRTPGGIKPLMAALTEAGTALGFDVRTRISEHPKVYWRTTSDTGVPLRLKIEVNTHERSPAQALQRLEHSVDSEWWSGSAKILTFHPAELVATKIRALYQRSKGRDLFDLWLALTEMGLAPDAILASVGPYLPDGLTSAQAIANLRRKASDPGFADDLDRLLVTVPTGYSVLAAADAVIELLLSRLDE
ncbi:nucleotidyl transferase AbiEii/AbiGii toxin family protein [Promicromonospora soli]